MIPQIGFTEILVVVLLVAVVFGARRIPEVFRGVGEGLREFRRAIKG
jgi:sec-independent protein translocase protein TatA